MQAAFYDILKNSRAYEIIKKDIATALGHAYMIVSPDEEILDEFFTLIAAAAYCEKGDACFECAECKKVLHDNHADIFYLNRKHEKIKVDDISGLLSTVAVKPLSDKKLYFIHRADLMNAQSQNKLLKTFEEPPKDVTVFLGVVNEAAMLDTVKSRSRTVYIDLFDEHTVFEALSAMGIDGDACAIAAACCEGQLGKARKIAMSDDYAQIYSSAVQLLENLNRSGDIVKLDGIITAQKSIADFLDVLSIIVRDMLVAKQNETLMLSKHIGNNIKELSGKYSEHALAHILMCVNDARRKLSLNVNGAATADALLFSILEARHKWQQ